MRDGQDGRASLQACLSERDAWNQSEGPYPTASHAEGRHHTQATEELSYLARRGGAAWDRRGFLPSELSPRILPATQQGVESDSRLCSIPLPETLFCLSFVRNSGMCGDLVPQGLGDGTGFPKHRALWTQAQSVSSCLQRVGMKGQCLSAPHPLPSPDCSMCPWATASPSSLLSPPDPVPYTDCWKQRACL